jgi:hypothetical protein
MIKAFLRGNEGSWLPEEEGKTIFSDLTHFRKGGFGE